MSLRAAVSARDALDGASTAIKAGGSASPRLDAELLLAEALGTTRERLVMDPDQPVAGDAVRRYQAFVRRRSVDREPVAYIVGRRGFRYIDLLVDRRVLVPRPETELLVEVGLELAAGTRVLDCCTGSGAVALALADERTDLVITGSDVSADAIAVAQANRDRLGLDVELVQADLLEGLGDRFDAILANSPYIPTATIPSLQPEVSRHEPRSALDGGQDGLDVVRALIEQAANTSATLIAIEIGEGQVEAVRSMLTEFNIASRRDLAGIERVLVATR
jgi:release factor glutamine methyltransferase